MAPVPLQIVSDLHLETHPSYDFALKQEARYLALLGDIGHVADDGLFRFLEKQLRRYWIVFFLLGNHEPARTTWAAARARVRSFAERMEGLRVRSTVGRFLFLDQTRYDMDDTHTILGCTLFSQVLPEQAADVASRFVDFKEIHAWTVQDHVDAHLSDLQWLNAQVPEISRTEPQREVIIFTHHSPTVDARAADPRHKDSTVSSGFCSDLTSEECWKSKSVVLWAFGHTHYSCDFIDSLGKRVVANQKGYYRASQEAFDMRKVFLIGRDAELE